MRCPSLRVAAASFERGSDRRAIGAALLRSYGGRNRRAGTTSTSTSGVAPARNGRRHRPGGGLPRPCIDAGGLASSLARFKGAAKRVRGRSG